MKIRYLLPVAAMVALTACSTIKQMQMKNTDTWILAHQHMAKGQWQQAIDKFTQLQQQYPENTLTAANIKTAQDNLNRENAWLSKVEQNAPKAEAQGLSAKAMVLYGSVNQYRPSYQAQLQFRALEDQLIQQHRRDIQLSSTVEVVNPASFIVDRRWQAASNPYAEHWRFSMSAPKVDFIEDVELVKTQYQVGTEEVANPEFLALEQEVAQLQLHKQTLVDKLEFISKQLAALEPTPTAMPSVTAAPSATAEPSATAAPSISQTPTAMAQTTPAPEDPVIASLKQQQAKLEQEYIDLENQIAAHKQNLEVLPPFVEQAVMEDWIYDKINLTKTLTVKLNLHTPAGIYSEQFVEQTSGSTWLAQPELALSEQTFRPASDEQMQQNLHNAIKQKAKHMFEHALKQSIAHDFNQQRQQQDWQQRMELNIIEAMLTTDKQSVHYNNLLAAIYDTLAAEYNDADLFRLADML